MKEEKRILNVLGQVDEKYIDEAAPGKKANKKPAWKKWTSIAACLALVAVLICRPPSEQTAISPYTPGREPQGCTARIAAFVEAHAALGKADEVVFGFLQLERVHIKLLVDVAGVEQKRVGRDAEQGLCQLGDAGDGEVLQVLRRE
jgi:hypothetical protein